MTNKVTVDRNMFGTLMEDVIVGNLDGEDRKDSSN